MSLFEVFLSCSFAAVDREVVRHFRALCGGMGFSCFNVSGAFSESPAEVARVSIARSDGVIAVLTRRGALSDGSYAAPAAVRDELAVAFALRKRLLIFCEDEVRPEGFLKSYATYMSFDRAGLLRGECLEQVIASLRTFRDEIDSGRRDASYQGPEEYTVSKASVFFALRRERDRFVWFASTKKRMEFSSGLRRDITTAIWPNFRWKRRLNEPPAEWGVELNAASRDFELSAEPDILIVDHLDARIRISPSPEAGDFVEYTRWFRSSHLNPLYESDISPDARPGVIKDGVAYPVYDGAMITERTLHLNYRCSFAPEYGLEASQVTPFVGEKTLVVDALVPAELKRMAVDIQSFGGELVVDLRCDRPQLHLFYGVAWSFPR
jgi:hypothetical protein